MSTLDTGLTLIRNASQRVSAANGWMGNAFKSWMPTGLYARALLIMIVPMVVLQTVVAFVFMERHWNTVTQRLSEAVVRDIASLIDIYKFYPQDKDHAILIGIAQNRLGLLVDFLPGADLPPPGPKPFSPGIITSRINRSKCSPSSLARASLALIAVVTR